jgi:hypothetical protein
MSIITTPLAEGKGEQPLTLGELSSKESSCPVLEKRFELEGVCFLTLPVMSQPPRRKVQLMRGYSQLQSYTRPVEAPRQLGYDILRRGARQDVRIGTILWYQGQWVRAVISDEDRIELTDDRFAIDDAAGIVMALLEARGGLEDRLTEWVNARLSREEVSHAAA